MQSGDLLEVYSAPNQLEADRLVLMLAEDGVEAITRATTMSSFPVTGSVLLVVPADDAEKARKIIGNARREGAVTDRGELL